MPRQAPEEWRQQLGLDDLEQQEGLPAGMLTAIVERESAGNPQAYNKGSKASGLFQFIPATAKAYGIDPYKPEEAAPAAAKMLGDLYRKYDGDVDKVVAGWNWGQGNVDRLGMKRAPRETRDFIKFMNRKVEGTDPFLAGFLAKQQAPTAPLEVEPEGRGLLASVGNLLSPASAEAATAESPNTDPFLAGFLAKQQQVQGEVATAPSPVGPYAPGEQKPEPPRTATIRFAPGVTDEQIAQAFGYDFDMVRQSKYYRDGMFARRVTDPNSKLAKVMDSVLGSLLRGVRDPVDAGNQLAQRGLRTIGLASDADVAVADISAKLAEADYQQNIRGGRGVDPATGQANFDAGRLVGNMVVPSIAGKAAQALGAGAKLVPGLAPVASKIVGAMSAPGVVASAARGIGYGAGAALEAPVVDTGQGTFADQKMRQAGYGAAAGGVMGPIAENLIAPGINKVINARRGVMREGVNEIQTVGRREGIRTTAGDEAGAKAPNIRGMEIIQETIPGIGMAGTRAGQAEDVAVAAARRTALLRDAMRGTRYRGLADIEKAAAGTGPYSGQAKELLQAVKEAGDDWTQIIQVSGNLRALTRKLKADELYATVDQIAEPLGKAVKTTQTIKALDDIGARLQADTLEGTGKALPSDRTVDLLDNLRGRLSVPKKFPSDYNPPVGRAASDLRPPVDLTYSQLRTYRHDIDELMESAQAGGRNMEFAALARVRKAIQDDLTDFAMGSGNPELATAARNADRWWEKVVVPYRDRKLAAALANESPDHVYGAFIRKATTPNDATRFFNALDPKGRAAVKVGMFEEAARQAYNKETGLVSATRMARYFRDQEAAYGALFKGAEKQEVDGFINLFERLTRASAYADHPPTGARNVAATIYTALASGAAWFQPGPTGAFVVATLGLRSLFTSDTGKKLLLAAAKLPEDSPAWTKLLERAAQQITPRAAGRASGDRATRLKMTIDNPTYTGATP